MPNEREEDEEQKPLQQDVEEGEPSEPVAEEKQERDPDEAVFAEQAIHSYAEEVLSSVEPVLEGALTSFSSWVLSQPNTDLFRDPAFLDAATSTFLDQVSLVFGSRETPIGSHLMGFIASSAAQSQASATSADELASMLGTSCRDACWYLRDNLQGVLSNQWDQLRDLAYEGSTDFIPVLHELGLPMIDADPNAITSPMVAVAEEYRATIPEKQEEVAEAEGQSVDEELKAEAEEQKEAALEEETERAV